MAARIPTTLFALLLLKVRAVHLVVRMFVLLQLIIRQPSRALLLTEAVHKPATGITPVVIIVMVDAPDVAAGAVAAP